MTGVVEPDERTVAFLQERRGVAFELESWMTSDPGASYCDVIRIDGGTLEPMLACPGDPGRGVPVSQLEESVRVGIAYGGSCTAGKRDDFDAYHDVLRWGLDNGLKVAAGTRLYLQFGTMDVQRYCSDRGYLDTFDAAGVTLVMPGCGACANCGPGQSSSPDDVTISAINRNFPGRSGPGRVWLASPYTVAASALTGRITDFDALRRGMP
jgi:3-isopropylmalate/(R)-2-methylmalate dehydratase large subunit